jgi:hypothetical protein
MCVEVLRACPPCDLSVLYFLERSFFLLFQFRVRLSACSLVAFGSPLPGFTFCPLLTAASVSPLVL